MELSIQKRAFQKIEMLFYRFITYFKRYTHRFFYPRKNPNKKYPDSASSFINPSNEKRRGNLYRPQYSYGYSIRLSLISFYLLFNFINKVYHFNFQLTMFFRPKIKYFQNGLNLS